MKRILGIIALITVALIFGLAYIPMSVAAEHMGPFTLNAIRFVFGGLVLMPSLLIKDGTDMKKTLKISLLLSFFVFVAPNLQQAAMADTGVGKAAFITTMYIVLVPVLTLIFKKRKMTLKTVISIVLAIIGLYILCNLKINDLSFRKSDIFLILTAILFSVQIVTVEHVVTDINPLKLSALSNFIGGLVSVFFVFSLEKPTMDNIRPAYSSLIVLILVSTVLGYTLQLWGQQHVDSTTASLIMSLESVFSALGGYVLLNQTLSTRELIGGVIMMAAVILSQLPEKTNVSA